MGKPSLNSQSEPNTAHRLYLLWKPRISNLWVLQNRSFSRLGLSLSSQSQSLQWLRLQQLSSCAVFLPTRRWRLRNRKPLTCVWFFSYGLYQISTRNTASDPQPQICISGPRWLFQSLCQAGLSHIVSSLQKWIKTMWRTWARTMTVVARKELVCLTHSPLQGIWCYSLATSQHLQKWQ